MVVQVTPEIDAAADQFVRWGPIHNPLLLTQPLDNLLHVPEGVLEFEGDKTYVHVLTSPEGAEEQTFERREVVTGLSDGTNMEIREGLSETDRVRGAAIPHTEQ